jgi:uncharacterized membrane protein YphA (DoxX/SURF4 family)
MVTMAFGDVIGYMKRRLSSPGISFEEPSTGGATMTLWTVVMWAGRVLVAAFFLMSAFNHLTKSAMLAGYAQSKGVPMAQVSTIVTGLMMLAGALSVLTGWHVTAFIMHNYWTVADPMAQMGERINFWKNITIAGALLLYAAALHHAY